MATRWNSTYNIIKAALELWKPLIYIRKNTFNAKFKELMLKDYFLLLISTSLGYILV